MKIKSRKEKLLDYNDKYQDRIYDSEKSLRSYFKDRNWDLDKASAKAAQKLKQITEEREYETIRITMYEYPMKTDRPRSTKFGRIYSPNAAVNHDYFDQAIRKVCKTIKLISTPAEITIEAYMEMPARVQPDEVILFEAKVLDVIDMPDYDNIGKCYTDILKNVLVTDDDVFHIGTVKKFYSVIPRVEITITYQKLLESNYIYKKLKNRKSVKAFLKTGQIELKQIEQPKRGK